MSENPVTEDVRIELTSHGRGKVFVNGVEINMIQSIKLETYACGLNQLTLTLIPARITVNAPAHVIRESAVLVADVTDIDSGSRKFAKADA